MGAVWMHIDKFGGVVKINDDHPLAVAQRERDAEKATAEPSPSAEPEVASPNAPAAPPVPSGRRKR